jgi:ferredoxin
MSREPGALADATASAGARRFDTTLELPGKRIRGKMMLKLAAIWGMPGEPVMPRVTYFHEITLEDVPRGQTLLDLSIRHRIPHHHQCGGYGRCTTCRIQILDGLSNVSPLGEVEQKVASQRGWDECTRLACQSRVEGDVVIRRLLDNAQDIIVLDLEEIRGGTASEGKELDLAILFSDIRDFTGASRACLMTSCIC